jgi:hypothetical protein
LPDNSFKARAKNFEADKEWWLKGAYSEEGVPLKDSSISESTSKAYWERFLSLVAFVDFSYDESALEREETFMNQVKDYLSLENFSWWISFFASERRAISRTGVTKSYSEAYIQTLAKCFRALARAFVLPGLGGEETPAGQKLLKLVFPSSCWNNHACLLGFPSSCWNNHDCWVGFPDSCWNNHECVVF